jgi:hypothetical protein
MRTCLAIALIIVVTGVSSANAQPSPTQTVVVNTSPSGAEVSINDNLYGNTPLEVSLPPGEHIFRFSLAGYPTRLEKYIVAGTRARVWVDLAGPLSDPSLRKLTFDPLETFWDSPQDVFYTLADRPTWLSADAASGAVTYDSVQPNIVADIALPAASPVFPSPSGRYLVFADRVSNYFQVLDTSTNKMYGTSILYTPNLMETISRTNVYWSSDETRLQIEQSRFMGEYVFLTTNGAEYKFVRIFSSSSGETVVADHVLSPASKRKQTLILGNANGTRYLWLVDLVTLRGIPLPIQGVLDAGFTPDGEEIIVVHRAGITRFSIDLTRREEVDTVTLRGLGAYEALLSNTTNFVLLTGFSTEAPMYWLYEMPRR